MAQISKLYPTGTPGPARMFGAKEEATVSIGPEVRGALLQVPGIRAGQLQAPEIRGGKQL